MIEGFKIPVKTRPKPSSCSRFAVRSVGGSVAATHAAHPPSPSYGVAGRAAASKNLLRPLDVLGHLLLEDFERHRTVLQDHVMKITLIELLLYSVCDRFRSSWNFNIPTL